MNSIPQAVKKSLDGQPLLLEFLWKGLANISAVAEQFQAPIEEELGRSVKLAAISMAIRRYIEEERPPTREFEFPDNLEISSKSNVYEVAFRRTKNAASVIENIRKKINIVGGDFISMVEGSYEVVIFTNQKHKSELKKILSRCKITSERDDLAYVTVNWTNCTKDIPGIYCRITQGLAAEGISIQSFHTIGAEMMLFFKSDAFSKAHQVLTKMLNSSA